ARTGPRSTLLAIQPLLACTSTSGGQVITGGSWSDTVTSCVQVLVLPCASVAVQVTVVVPRGKMAGASCSKETRSQLSSAAGTPKSTPVAPHAALAATSRGGGQSSVGGDRSNTVICWVQVPVFPARSIAVHVTVVDPKGKDAVALWLTVAVPQLSATMGLPRCTATVAQPEFVDTCWSEGQEMVGGVRSESVTSCVQVRTLPLASVAVHTTTVR